MTTLRIAQDAHADQVLSADPFALLVGMLLDQQFPMERAFAGPATVLDRWGTLDPAAIAAADPEEFAAACSRPPAIHRFPGAMAARIQALAARVVADYGGDGALVWRGVGSGAELVGRLADLPGFGPQKARIFTALLAKQVGVAPPGWREASGDYGEEGAFHSVADVVDAESLERVRSFKKQAKAAAKARGAGR